MKSKPRVYRIVHFTSDGRTLYHLGSGCRLSSKKSGAEHFVTNDPMGQAMLIKNHLEFGINAKCADTTPDHQNIEFTTFEVVPRREITKEDKLAHERRFGVAA